MARYAMIHTSSGDVVRIIEWDGNTATWTPPTGYNAVADPNNQAGVGSNYDGTNFVPPPAGLPGTASQGG